MTEFAPVLTQCKTCRHPLVDVINRRMTKEGWSDVKLSEWLKSLGDEMYVSRISLGNHRREHLATDFVRAREEAAKRLEEQKKTRKGPSTSDLAVLIRDTVVEEVASGNLAPTIAEGLRAQEILDRRAEKGEDRNLIVQVAQILSGAAPVALLGDGAIEGEFRELADEELADEELFRQLEAGPSE